MKSLQITQPNHADLIELPIPKPQPGEVLVKVMASGICGTDIHIYRGEYLGGYPIIPGHEFSGLVEAAGNAVTRFKPGDRVAVEPNIACDNCHHCLNNRHNFCQNWSAIGVTRPGGMAQYTTVPEKALFNIGEIPFEHGAFMEPLSCVLHGVSRLQPGIASSIALFGAGPIGILLLQMLRLQGAAEITVVDRNPSRFQFALHMGADAALPSLDDLPRQDYDLVVDATGAIPIMNRTIDFVRQGGKILLFGVPPSGAKLTLDAFTIFQKGLSVLSSFTSRRNSYQALDLLKHGRISIDGLISHCLPLSEFQLGIDLLEGGLQDVKKVLLLPNEP
jgi:2-desacetyl-2-hydroxyethyl bacteriochlorophyllide A dehydrogenase